MHVEVLDEQNATVLATAELAGGFQMLSEASSPLVAAASEASGSTEGGLLLCLRGARLNSSATPPTLTLGAAACVLRSINDTAVCCLTAAHPAGAANLSLFVEGVGYALHAAMLQPFTFTYVAPPQLLSISPTVGHVGSLVALVGSGLSGGGGSPVVRLGGAACAVVQSNDTHVTCTASSSPLGSVPVAATVDGVGLALVNGSGSTSSSSLRFTYRAVITTISPTNGSVGGGLPLTLTGVAAWSKCHPWHCPSSAPAPPQGAPGGSGRLWEAKHSQGGAQPVDSKPPHRGLTRAASKVADFTALDLFRHGPLQGHGRSAGVRARRG